MLNELNLKEAINGLINGDFTSVELVEACYNRIDAVDDYIKAFITVLPKEDAIKEANKADTLIKEKGKKAFEEQPLLGIPYACKDNYNTLGIQTTASSKILDGYISQYESTVTQKLKDAGAILIGKNNMDAFAHGASTETSDYFTTKNPWNLDKLPGGSSGGTTAAVVANMCIFGIGSDTGGSIRCPASWCGVTGLKPTYGRVSRYGIIAMASSTDSPGPITKTSEDAALVLKVMSGLDPLDATSSPKPIGNYGEEINEIEVKNLKIGIARSFFVEAMEAGVKERLEECIKKFEDMGAKVFDIEIMDPKYSLAVYTVIQRSEVSSNLARFDGIRYGHTRDNFGAEARKRMMLGGYALSSGYYDEYYSKAQKVRTAIIQEFDNTFKEVDVVFMPTIPTVAQDVGSTAASPMHGELTDNFQFPASMAGLCAVSFPCGFSEGLPVGAQLVGPQFEESRILGAVHKYQLQTEHHRKYPDLEELK